MILVLFVAFAVAVNSAHACAGMQHGWNPMGAQDPRASPQQLRNVSLMFGDMAFTRDQMKMLREGNVNAAPVTNIPLWKDGIIPYVIDCSLENMPWALKAVKAAQAQWMRKTCIRFVKRTTEKIYLTFFRNTHCWGNVGMVDYSHISVGPGCEYEHVMAHEMGHVIGYWHEQNRKDRDQWVKIHWENIGQFKSAFDIVKNSDSTIVNFDYASIMMYPWTAFSSNGKITMEPIRDTHGKVPYIEVSHDDVYVTDRIYHCPALEKRRRQRKMRQQRTRYRVAKTSNKFIREECVDLYRYCPEWAKAGYCDQEESVRLGCRMSCSDPVCQGSDCIDQGKDCQKLSKKGECSTDPSVAMRCQKSCNPVCTYHPTTPTPIKTTVSPKPTKGGDEWPNRNFLGIGRLCMDRHKSCPEWAKSGMCDTPRNKQWMVENCQKSCPGTRCDPEPKRPPGRCNNPLGLHADLNQQYRVPDSAFYASTQLDPGAGWHAAPRNARLYFEDDFDAKRVGGWCSGHDHPEYIQVDLQQEYTISYIATQGRDKYYERISKFKINYSLDGNNYQTYQEGGLDKAFYGNCDHFTPVLNRFKNLRARYIRLVPVEFNWPCLRMEFYGC